MTIWKYLLTTKRRQDLYLPEGASILAVQVQGDDIALWALVAPGGRVSEKPRVFGVYPTGGEAPADAEGYLGTVQLAGGALVFHVFEVIG